LNILCVLCPATALISEVSTPALTSHHIWRTEMILGLMNKAKPKHRLARPRLTSAEQLVQPA